MNKVKILIAFLIVFVVGVGGYFGYQFFTQTIVSVEHPFDAIPDNNAFIIEAKSIEGLHTILNTDSNFISKVTESFQSDSTYYLWEALYLEFSKDNASFKNFNTNPIYLSSHFMGLDKFNYLISIKINQNLDKDDFSKFLKRNGKINTIDFEGVDLYSYTSNKGSKTIYFTLNKGILSISVHRPLIEKVIFTIESGKEYSKESLNARLIKMSGENTLNLYLNYKYLYRFFAQYATEYRDNVKQMGLFAERAELDVKINDNQIITTGYSIYSDSVRAYLNLLQGTEPQVNTLLKVLPYNTMFLSYTGVTDYDEFYKKTYSYFNSKMKNKRLAMEEKYSFSTENDILSWINKEVSFCLTNCDWEKEFDHSYAVISATDIKEAQQQLIKIGNRASEINNKATDTISYRAYEIRKIEIPFFVPNMFGHTFNNLSQTYFTTVGNTIVFGNSQIALKQFIDSYLIGKTLAEDSEFKEFSYSLSDKSNLLTYFNLKYYDRYFSHLLNMEVVNNDHLLKQILSKIGAIAIEFSAGENGAYTSVVTNIGEDQDEEKEGPVSWQEALDAPVIKRPYLIVNHNTKEREILVFDNQNSMYRIDKQGNIAWKIPLLETPMSDVYMVDYYKNDKYQYVFNTANYIYIVDLNGNRVDNYPFRLPSSAVGQMSLMDYDNNKNYRILVPLDDGKLHNFNLEQSPTPGWVNASFSRDYITPVEHFRLQDKDFLLFADTLGNVIFANRRGEARMEAKLGFTNNSKTAFFKVGKGRLAKIATTDLMGRVVEIDADGNVEKLNFDEFSPDHFFQLCDFDMDGNMDFVFFDRNRLKIFTPDKVKILDTLFADFAIDEMKPINKHTADSIRLILHDKNANTLIFITSSGNIINNKEFISSKNFIINQATKNNYLRLITVNNRVVSNFLIK